ncbi:MAG: glutamate--cysteine ligase [Halioglobus sp.]|nr:glutamate--cysteine ligase [Halioglobus sp.]
MHKQLKALEQPEARADLTAINRGIEKESLRITARGHLAQTHHPYGLGSALSHPSITTDYSEALLEFITPVSSSVDQSLLQLEDIHSFTYQKIGKELLWSASMPCLMTGEKGIPVAQYGSSNVARMKTVYRYGLGHRYGRLMQTIAGIHYNFSMPATFWQRTWRDAGSPGDIADYTTQHYLGLIRNFSRLSWILIYLFGASPAVCASFLNGRRDHGLQLFDGDARSLCMPYGTALRMGSLGYNSDAQKNLNVCYNSLDTYIETLCAAIMQPHPAYRDIPSGKGGNYQQLNDSLLQIENEFYSPIRPKRVAMSGEAPLRALVRGGIEYIEVRCVDISPFTPVGLDAEQLRFMDTFLLYCLLQESPACEDNEQARQVANLEAIISRGREPGLSLQRDGGDVPMVQWARELLEEMAPLAALLDSAYNIHDYQTSLGNQMLKLDNPELTPSARVLREMRERRQPFFKVAMAYSEQWARYFRQRPLSHETQSLFEEASQRSLQAQKDTERADQLSFENYLENFYAQYKSL